MRRVARTQTLVDTQQGFFVARRVIIGHRVEQMGRLRRIHDLDQLHARRANHFRDVLGDPLATFNDDFTRAIAADRVNNVANRDFTLDLGCAAPVDDFLFLGFVKLLKNIGVEAKLGPHRTQQRNGRELTALVDSDRDTVLLGRVELDPATTFGNHTATVRAALTRFDFRNEIDTRTAMQLTHHDALGTIDDEFAAAEHDRQIAQIDFFLDGLFLHQAQPNAKGAAIGEAQLPALVRFVARLAQIVAQVFELDRFVVALDRKDFAEHTLQAVVFAIDRRGSIVLQEPRVAFGLDFCQVGDVVGNTSTPKGTDFGGL